MPQIKAQLKFHGIHHVLNYQPAVIKFAKRRLGVFRSDEFLILAKVASNPIHLFGSGDGNKLRESFGLIYASHPDDTLDLLKIIRKILKRWDESQFGTVIKYLCKRTSIRNEAGILVAIASLQDKELSKLLKVHPDSVKKARQTLSRIGKHIDFWNHPETIKYKQTGIHTEEFKRLYDAYSKGKK